MPLDFFLLQQFFRERHAHKIPARFAERIGAEGQAVDALAEQSHARFGDDEVAAGGRDLQGQQIVKAGAVAPEETVRDFAVPFPNQIERRRVPHDPVFQPLA